jgi:hypothetical protein
MGADQRAKSELSRLRGARELRLLNGRGGQESRGKRWFQSAPARDAQCHQLPVKGLSQLRKRAGQSGEHKRRPRLPINYTHDLVVSAVATFRQLSSVALRRNRGGLIISPGDDPKAMESTAKADKLTLSEWIGTTIHATLQR